MTQKVIRIWLSIIGLGFMISAISSYCHSNTIYFMQSLVIGSALLLIALVMKRPMWVLIIGSAGAVFQILTTIFAK